MLEIEIQDKIKLLIIQQERQLNEAKQELKNENLTQGQHRELHVEIEKLKFCLETLNFIYYD